MAKPFTKVTNLDKYDFSTILTFAENNMRTTETAYALNNTEGMGYFRLARFAKEQQKLTEEYYTDPEYQEEKLNQRLEQLGFRVVNGRLYGAIDEDRKTVATKNLEGLPGERKA